MADKATETQSSKFISSIEENASDPVKMMNSTDEGSNSTLDAYELEFERVMYEQEKQEMSQKYAETVTLNSDIPRGGKSSASTETNEEEDFTHIDCDPCDLNKTSQKNIHTLTRGESGSEPSHNKSLVLAETSKSESYIHVDCAPCKLNRTLHQAIPTSTRGKSGSEPSHSKSRVSAATCANTSFIRMIWNKSPTQATTKSHTSRLGVSGLSCNDRIEDDYPPELNPFSDDNQPERGKGTNPFEDSDNEENVETRPKPRPRTHTHSSMGLEQCRNRLPIPLPRTASKSVPTTPHQSPLLLHHNRSFRLPNSGPSSTYNSIRRKKKPAPLPPCHPHSDTINVYPKTKGRPRKARPAPPPPPDQN